MSSIKEIKEFEIDGGVVNPEACQTAIDYAKAYPEKAIYLRSSHARVKVSAGDTVKDVASSFERAKSSGLEDRMQALENDVKNLDRRTVGSIRIG